MGQKLFCRRCRTGSTKSSPIPCLFSALPWVDRRSLLHLAQCTGLAPSTQAERIFGRIRTMGRTGISGLARRALGWSAFIARAYVTPPMTGLGLPKNCRRMWSIEETQAMDANNSTPTAAQMNAALLCIRIASALVFLFHGSLILFGAFGGPGPQGFAQFMHMRPLSVTWWD
jgi:hypothetical protein